MKEAGELVDVDAAGVAVRKCLYFRANRETRQPD